MTGPASAGETRPIVVVGGSGFIGSNLAESFLAEGHEVVVVDNLSRAGVEDNLAWLTQTHGSRVHAVRADIRDADALATAVADAQVVFHLAAQTAVTTSLDDPVDDFEVNARGTLNVLEAVRATGRRVPVIFASTNKVYGGLEDVAVEESNVGYRPTDLRYARNGVSEARPLDFCTPYGCSKGVADQYVLDYAKSFDLPTAVLRMSCIYGPRQFGTEDQGWVAHFLLRALNNEPISIFGDGKQVRDILHVRDCVAAYRRVLDNIDTVSGQAFNLGGGTDNSVSLRLVLDEIGRLVGHPLRVDYDEWRKGDQLYFVADTTKLRNAVGWEPTIGWQEGIADLAQWLRTHRAAPSAVDQPRAVTA